MCSLAAPHVEGCRPGDWGRGYSGRVGGERWGRTVAAAATLLGCGWRGLPADAQERLTRDLPPRPGARPQPDQVNQAHHPPCAAETEAESSGGTTGEGTPSLGPAGSHSQERRLFLFFFFNFIKHLFIYVFFY